MDPRTILDQAAEVTAGDRQHFYGHPRDNHGNTALLWRGYLQRRFGLDMDLDARDVCMLMILLKVSRDANLRKEDNLVDIAGYARNAEQVGEIEQDFRPIRVPTGELLEERVEWKSSTGEWKQREPMYQDHAYFPFIDYRRAYYAPDDTLVRTEPIVKPE